MIVMSCANSNDHYSKTTVSTITNPPLLQYAIVNRNNYDFALKTTTENDEIGNTYNLVKIEPIVEVVIFPPQQPLEKVRVLTPPP